MRLPSETFPGLDVDGFLYAEFVRSLAGRVCRPVVLVHDNLVAHGGEWVEDVLDDFPRLD